MPTRPKGTCRTPGCLSKVVASGYCGQHKAPSKQSTTYDAKEHKKLYNSSLWIKILRPTILARDPFCVCTNPECGHHIPCGKLSTVVDHITPRESGGTDEEDNLQGLCKPCHDHKSMTEDGFRPFSNGPTITILCGPPGSGKSTYVNEHMRRGDLLIDFARLNLAINPTLHRAHENLVYIWEARDHLYEQLLKPTKLRRAWIIECAAKRERRQYLRSYFKGSRLIVMETPAHICLDRIAKDATRDNNADWTHLVHEWWQDYEPNDYEERI